jgi:hypothetical protein
VSGFAGFLWKPNMPGKDLRAPGVSADNVYYIDLGELGVDHRYFVAPGQKKQKKQKNLAAFYAHALCGRAVALESIARRGSLDGVPVHTLPRNERSPAA